VSGKRRSRVLLVSALARADVEKLLEAAGCRVTRTNAGETAVDRVRRENFDVAVLMSTGETMDIIETALNLADIRRSLPIIIIANGDDRQRNLKPIPNVRYCSATDLPAAVDSARGPCC
jgi:CheY-like chemotaxis protein